MPQFLLYEEEMRTLIFPHTHIYWCPAPKPHIGGAQLGYCQPRVFLGALLSFLTRWEPYSGETVINNSRPFLPCQLDLLSTAGSIQFPLEVLSPCNHFKFKVELTSFVPTCSS